MPGSYDGPVLVEAPDVTLGNLAPGGLAPAIMAIVERGVQRRPAHARSLRAEVELTMDEGYPPVRIVFGEQLVLIEDAEAVEPDLRIMGSLPDLISLMVAPLVAGLPVPISARGRAAFGIVVGRRVRVEGRLRLMRHLLILIRV